jgi:hypothetical protein
MGCYAVHTGPSSQLEHLVYKATDSKHFPHCCLLPSLFCLEFGIHVTLVVTRLTVAHQSIKAALADPVKALRYE